MIVIRNSDGLVVFPSANLLDETGCYGNGWYSSSTTSADHIAIDTAPPEPWIPHGYTWNGEGYEVTEAGLVELNRVKVAAYQAELKVLNEQYKADLQQLQLSWLSATVADGADVAMRQADIQVEVAQLKDQFLSDKQSIRWKYFPPV